MDFSASYAPMATWPANQRAAVVIIIHVDAAATSQSVPGESPGLDYTASGFQRLLNALTDLDLPATTAWTARAVSSFPQLVRSAADAGHEVASSLVHEGSDPGADQALERAAGTPATGVVTSLPVPGARSTATTTGAGSTSGKLWVVTGMGGDVPVSLNLDDEQGLSVIPVSPYWIDQTWLSPENPSPPSSLLEAWSLGLAAVREEGGLMTVILHPHVAGRPGFSSQIVRFLDEVIGAGDVWIATAGQVTEWWQSDHDDDEE